MIARIEKNTVAKQLVPAMRLLAELRASLTDPDSLALADRLAETLTDLEDTVGSVTPLSLFGD